VIIDEATNDQIEVVGFSAGKNHVSAICSSKKVHNGCGNCLYVWGTNKYGQLGTWDFDIRSSPTYIETDYNPTSVTCGHSYTVVQS
jgi:alpha-tubulin suppressor-like RCC1 family protein